MNILLLLLFVILTEGEKTFITIHKITASSDISTKKTSEYVQHIAVNEINANDNILGDYQLKLNVLDSVGDSETALVNSINISQLYDECSINDSSLISPIVMGAPWSSFSVLTSRVFNIYHLLQISATATSPALSEKDKYSSFFRTIANDNLQGEALVKLCNKFGWTRIGVVYQNDNYGQNFNTVIQQQADEYNLAVQQHGKDCIQCMQVHSKPFLINNTNSINTAAQYIKDQKLYVTILIAQGSDLYNFFTAVNFSYPYFFIGTDAWFDVGEIKTNNISNFTMGFIGTMPGNIAMFSREEYNDIDMYNRNVTIYNISNQIYQNVTAKLKKWQKNDPFEIRSAITGYAYDAMYSAAQALHKYDLHYPSLTLKQQLMNCTALDDISKTLRNILNHIEFIGMSGLVKFKDGDTSTGLFVYGIVEVNNTNVTIRTLGHFTNDSAVIDIANIRYPNTNKPVRSDIVVNDILIGINFQTIGMVATICGFICLLALVLLYKRKSVEGKVEYLSMTIGLILNCMLMISYGLQKNPNIYVGHNYQIWYDIWCVSSPIIVCMAFTLTFLAFITWKSELMRLIIKFIKKGKIEQIKGDKNTCNKLLKSLAADFIVIALWLIVYFINMYFQVTNVKLLHYDFIKMGGQQTTNDPLEEIQNLYPVCSAHWSINIFYCVLLIYKIIQMLYAIDNNVGGMISYIILIICMCCISLIAAVWYTLDQMLYNGQIHQHLQYSILSFVIICVYLLWIIPEYYYLCNKCSSYDTDESATDNNTQTNTPCTFPHSHTDNTSNVCTEINEE